MDKPKGDARPKIPKQLAKFDLEIATERAILESNSQSFVGMPMSGSSPDKLVLVVDPGGIAPKTIEFNTADVERVDELTNSEHPVTHEQVRQARVWVRNGASFLMYVHGSVVARPKLPTEPGRAGEPLIERVFGARDLSAQVSLWGCSCPTCSCRCASSCSSCLSCPCIGQDLSVVNQVVAVANTSALNSKAADTALIFNDNISANVWWAS